MDENTRTEIERLAEEIISGLDFSVARCELCGGRVDPQRTEDGYTNCCNELILYGGCYGRDEMIEAAREIAYDRIVRAA